LTTARSFEGAAGAWFTVVRVLPREAGSRATLVARVNSERSIGLKVFAATKARERGFLGETITDWIRCTPSSTCSRRSSRSHPTRSFTASRSRWSTGSTDPRLPPGEPSPPGCGRSHAQHGAGHATRHGDSAVYLPSAAVAHASSRGRDTEAPGGPPGRSPTTLSRLNSAVLVEVTSDSSEDYDTTRLDAYKMVPSRRWKRCPPFRRLARSAARCLGCLVGRSREQSRDLEAAPHGNGHNELERNHSDTERLS